MIEAKELLEAAYGMTGLRVNCAANCNTRTFSTLASHGATDMEPGGAIAGSTFFEDLLEIPAQVYVSEVMHEWDGQVYTLGGGLSFIFSPDDTPTRCVVGTSAEDAEGRYMELVGRGVIDYFGVNTPPAGPRPRVGDTAVYAVGGPQMYVTRCYVAAVTGIANGQPVVAGLFDCAANELDERFLPVGRRSRRDDGSPSSWPSGTPRDRSPDEQPASVGGANERAGGNGSGNGPDRSQRDSGWAGEAGTRRTRTGRDSA